jgi:YbbR domain-containing protein
MIKKLGKTLINNIGLKLMAVAFAIVLWIVVVGIDDPTTTISYTTSISFSNQEYLTEQNKYFEPLDGNNTITFRVTAQRSIQEKLSNSDFTAVADLEKCEYDEKSNTFQVPVVVSTTKYSSSQVTISGKQLYKEIAVEDLGRVQKQIIAETQGTVADGCALGDVGISSSNLLKITGPYSVVSQIDRVVASISVDGLNRDATDVVAPILYDADGKVIDTNKLTLSVTSVTVYAQILNTKDVALEFATSGQPAEGYMVTGIEYNPSTVRIKGESSVLNPVNKITVPADILDVTGASEDITTTVDISLYPPSGTSLVLNADATIKVTVRVEPIITRSIEVPVGNLTIENLSETDTLEYVSENFVVSVSGAAGAVNQLDASAITGTVDAADLQAGEHYLPVKVSLESELYTSVTAGSVAVNLQAKENNRPASDSQTGDGTSAGGSTQDGSTQDGSTQDSSAQDSNSSESISTADDSEENDDGSN